MAFDEEGVIIVGETHYAAFPDRGVLIAEKR
jgi:hypothetical protein